MRIVLAANGMGIARVCANADDRDWGAAQTNECGDIRKDNPEQS